MCCNSFWSRKEVHKAVWSSQRSNRSSMTPMGLSRPETLRYNLQSSTWLRLQKPNRASKLVLHIAWRQSPLRNGFVYTCYRWRLVKRTTKTVSICRRKGLGENKLPVLLVGRTQVEDQLGYLVFNRAFHFHQGWNRKPLGILLWHLPTGLSPGRRPCSCCLVKCS